jgi:hypothetical protein
MNDEIKNRIENLCADIINFINIGGKRPEAKEWSDVGYLIGCVSFDNLIKEEENNKVTGDK